MDGRGVQLPYLGPLVVGADGWQDCDVLTDAAGVSGQLLGAVSHSHNSFLFVRAAAGPCLQCWQPQAGSASTCVAKWLAIWSYTALTATS